MPTTQKRINLTVDKTLYTQLQKLKKIRKTSSLSSVTLQLVKSALELQEDLYFAKIAEDRKKEPTISHQKLWRGRLS